MNFRESLKKDSDIGFNIIYAELIEKLRMNPEYVSTTRKKEIINEMLDVSFILLNPKLCFALCRDMSLDYLRGEIDFYLSGSPFLKDIVKHSKFWERVTDDNRTVNSNYGKLLLHDRNLHNYTQFEYAKDMLLRNPLSKKAVMTIYSNENAYKSNDNPCTMYLQFFIRPENDTLKLHLFVKMRSSDVWYGMPYDVPFFSLIQHLMLSELKEGYSKLEIGSYCHQSGTLHLYERNFNSCKDIFSIHTNERKKEQLGLFEDIILGGIEKWKNSKE